MPTPDTTERRLGRSWADFRRLLSGVLALHPAHRLPLLRRGRTARPDALRPLGGPTPRPWRPTAELRRLAGRHAEAAATYAEAIARTNVPDPNRGSLFTLAWLRAGRSHALGGVPGGAAAAEAAAEADRAIGELRRARAAGFRDADRLRRDDRFSSLRRHPHFALVLLDMDFPDDPFAIGR